MLIQNRANFQVCSKVQEVQFKEQKNFLRGPAKLHISIHCLILAMLLLDLFCGGAEALPQLQTMPNLLPTDSVETEATTTTDYAGITLQADRSGHYRGTLLINKTQMPFLIDTGATLTTIPMKLATGRLPFGKQVETNTAAGRAFNKGTQINSLTIGNVEIKNVEANINQHLDEVLLGMNVLKYFQINQTDNTLKLVINNKFLKEDHAGNGVSIGTLPPVAGEVAAEKLSDDTPSKPIMKSVICDERNHCITQYENQ